MSGTTNVGAKGAGATSATSAVVLPFTGGHSVMTYVLSITLICGLIILGSKLVKRVIAS